MLQKLNNGHIEVRDSGSNALTVVTSHDSAVDSRPTECGPVNRRAARHIARSLSRWPERKMVPATRTALSIDDSSTHEVGVSEASESFLALRSNVESMTGRSADAGRLISGPGYGTTSGRKAAIESPLLTALVRDPNGVGAGRASVRGESPRSVPLPEEGMRRVDVSKRHRSFVGQRDEHGVYYSVHAGLETAPERRCQREEPPTRPLIEEGAADKHGAEECCDGFS